MSDGSNLGINAGRALDTIVGGKDQPTEDEHQTPEQVRERIMAGTADTYEGATDCIARAYLRILEADPETHKLPLEAPSVFIKPGTGETIGYRGKTRIVKGGTFTAYDWESGDESEYVYVDTDDCLWHRLKDARKSPDEQKAVEGCTGFMMGFAYNQARWVLGLPPAPNPAIMTIGE